MAYKAELKCLSYVESQQQQVFLSRTSLHLHNIVFLFSRNLSMPHSEINPAIYYWGTPVVLITTTNEDGTHNIAPMSSAWWLGTRCMLGLSGESQTTINL